MTPKGRRTSPAASGIAAALAVACTLYLGWPMPAHAQSARLGEVRVGFRSSAPKDNLARYKVGLWTPVYVDLTAGADGLLPAGNPGAELALHTVDSEDVGTLYTMPVVLDKNESRTFIAYAKPGNLLPEIRVTVSAPGLELSAAPAKLQPLELGVHLYLSLGGQVPAGDLPGFQADLQETLRLMAPTRQDKVSDAGTESTWPRFAAYETDAGRLPTEWFGYDAVDLLFLHTTNRDFLQQLAGDRARIQALAHWVRHGGRLIVPVAWETADLLGQILEDPAWQPTVPIVPPRAQPNVEKQAIKRLLTIEAFARSNRPRPFPDLGEKPVSVAWLQSSKTLNPAWDVWADADGRPLMGRMPYGLGQIVLIAFPLDQGEFRAWSGRFDFLKELIEKVAPRAPVRQQQGAREAEGKAALDLTTDLQRTLDIFEVPVIPFGWVALLILIYIVVVGPLDYLILKNVFKRLEWTWITFPAVVLTVSVLAYVFSSSGKGHELEINKVDVVDFDLRTQLDHTNRPAQAYAYGKTFVTVLSPVIKSYTLGIQPNQAFWGEPDKKTLTADLVSWLGRPESDGPFAMGRPRSQSFFRKPYRYAPRAAGLEEVPIPERTTKSFAASWEARLASLPVEANLIYHLQEQLGKDLKLSGTLRSNLPMDLEDVWIFYRDRCYPLHGGLPAGGKPRTLALESVHAVDMRHWAKEEEAAPRTYNPGLAIKQLMFLEKLDSTGRLRNHSLRGLDQSWRLPFESRIKDGRIRDAVLVGRVRFLHGAGQDLGQNANGPLPTHLWLGRLPQPGATRPLLEGTLAQDTFVRVLLPVRPAEE